MCLPGRGFGSPSEREDVPGGVVRTLLHYPESYRPLYSPWRVCGNAGVDGLSLDESRPVCWFLTDQRFLGAHWGEGGEVVAMPARMAAVDAQFYWMSAKVPSDQFLLYAFAGEPVDFDRAVNDIRSRAHGCRHLMTRVDDGWPLTYPTWVPAAIEPAQVLRHQPDNNSWPGCLDAVVRLADDQLDVRRAPWRVHLFAPVHGIPDSSGPGTVAVMQVAHALADGARASALAGWLFGRAAPVPDVTALSPGLLPWHALDAARAHRKLVRDSRAGLLRLPVGSLPALSTNARPAGARVARTLVRRRSQLRGPTVTVAVPAPLLRWGVGQFDPDARLPRVSGNTVVSSVYRGPSDLRFGGAPVLLTAGYPALSPAMGLTHGVHGIGDTIAISVHAAESAVGDVDAYLRRLAVEL
jgi:hypothetical protein